LQQPLPPQKPQPLPPQKPQPLSPQKPPPLQLPLKLPSLVLLVALLQSSQLPVLLVRVLLLG
jgi:hypothetical protein